VGATVEVKVKSKRLDAAGDAACVGADGAGESKRLRMSLAVVLCGWEADVGAMGDVALEPPKISARRSSLVFWPPGTDTTCSEGADTSSPSRSAFLEEVAGEKKRNTRSIKECSHTLIPVLVDPTGLFSLTSGKELSNRVDET